MKKNRKKERGIPSECNGPSDHLTFEEEFEEYDNYDFSFIKIRGRLNYLSSAKYYPNLNIKDLGVIDYLKYWHDRKFKNPRNKFQWGNALIKEGHVYVRIILGKINEAVPSLCISEAGISKKINFFLVEEKVIRLVKTGRRLYVRFTNKFMRQYYGEKYLDYYSMKEKKFIKRNS